MIGTVTYDQTDISLTRLDFTLHHLICFPHADMLSSYKDQRGPPPKA